jgi:hypothetical protein
MTSCHIYGAKLVKFLHQSVRIETDRGTVVQGGVVAIDPVSNTAVLLSLDSCSDAATAELTVVPGVKWDAKVTLLPTDEATQNRLKKFVAVADIPEGYSVAECAARKARLCEHFGQHGLTAVQVGEKLVVQGCVTIRPPYRPEDCRAINEIVLERIVQLMKTFA